MEVLQLTDAAVAGKATDLFLVVGAPPLVRINGAVQPLEGHELLSARDVEEALSQLATVAERKVFEEEMELDFGYSLSSGIRLRCNVALQLNGISLAIRLLPAKIPTIRELQLPRKYEELVMEPRGLVFVSGPTGSGKSTTLAAMVHHLNTHVGRHVITIEDPIEYVHTGVKAAVTQRQLGTHTRSFARALKHSLRQNPDVILVGEMRDADTAAAVLSAAEAGHLILSTGQAPSAYQAVERIVDMFPVEERQLALTRLASLLVAIACQLLVPRADGLGRVAAVEMMIANPAIKAMIRDGKIHQLPNAIRTHRKEGMISMDESLVDLYLRGEISGETVLAFCRDPEEVASHIRPGGDEKKAKRRK
ncbi:MAG: twitching motility protein [Dehalococcoidia bacterium]|nr:twitching motility protein [Dehalococcoidia bacterium]